MNIKPRILVVDDERDILWTLGQRLVKWGFQPAFAQNGYEFEQQALSEDFDLIILDIMLGEQNGTDLYDMLLTRGLNRNIPVIFLSALAGDRPHFPISPGSTYALRGKPFDADELLEDINRLLHPVG